MKEIKPTNVNIPEVVEVELPIEQLEDALNSFNSILYNGDLYTLIEIYAVSKETVYFSMVKRRNK